MFYVNSDPPPPIPLLFAKSMGLAVPAVVAAGFPVAPTGAGMVEGGFPSAWRGRVKPGGGGGTGEEDDDAAELVTKKKKKRCEWYWGGLTVPNTTPSLPCLDLDCNLAPPELAGCLTCRHVPCTTGRLPRAVTAGVRLHSAGCGWDPFGPLCSSHSIR